MKSRYLTWELVTLATAVGFGMATVSVAQEPEAAELEGKIVEIAPAQNDDVPSQPNDVQPQQQVAESAFWIGVRGRNVEEPVIRTQFQLAADMGVVVEQVVPDSPAAKAGLRQHDILLRANGEVCQSMSQLADLVANSDGKPIELQLIRLGREETLVVVPEQRPADQQAELGGNAFGFGGDLQGFDDLLRGRNNAFRVFPGAGMGFNGQWQTHNVVPGGYAVTITRRNNEPVQIVVKKGDETWQVTGDDEEALQELPAEVQGHVKRMLDGPNRMFDLGDLQNWPEQFRPRAPRMLDDMLDPPQGFGRGGQQQDRVLERMEQLERQLEQLRKRLDEE